MTPRALLLPMELPLIGIDLESCAPCSA
jgi:hypothetical protein